jgi:hypothetical protein
MSRHDQVLSEFMDAWNAGRRPRMRDYLERVPAGPERDELADDIGTWLEVAPTPAYSAQTRAAIRSEPVVEAIFASVGADEGAWAVVLPRLRGHAGLGIRDLASRLVERFKLGAADEDRAAAYLEQLERGELRPERVSRRLLDALGGLLGVSGASLADLGGVVRGPAPRAAGAPLFRAEKDAGEWVSQDIEVLSRAAMAPAPEPMDELDRLFRGGADA